MKKVMAVAVGVIFDEKKRILLTKRYAPRVRSWHNKWQLPGGKVEYGENPTDALVREIKEETGLTIQLLAKHPSVYAQLYETQNVHSILLSYPAKYLKGTLNVDNDSNTSDAKWYGFDEIRFDSCLPWVKEMISDARKILKTKH